MKHILALLLAIVMTITLLAGCGGTKDTGGDIGGDEAVTTQEPGNDTSGDDEDSGEVRLTLNRTEVTLNAEGAAFQLKSSVEPAIDAATIYTSDDESVATVSEDGTITAVAPGTAVITAACGGAEAVCAVKCDWEEAAEPDETPEAMQTTPQTTPEPNVPAPAVPPAGGVDLAAFYDAVLSKYEMASMEDISGMADILDNFYAGLSGIATRQSLVCVAMMTGVVCEIALIEVSDVNDVEAVKAILQARIDYQIESGAFYPAAVDGWTNNSRIVTNGNYIMMIAHQDCDSIVSDFNALF